MKKQIIFHVMLAFLTSACFFSCTGNKKKIFDKITFDSININVTTHLFDSLTAPACNLVINYVYPVKGENTALTDSINQTLIIRNFGQGYAGLGIKEAIDSFKVNYVREYRTDLEPLYLEDRKNYPGRDENSWYNYYCTIDARPVKDCSSVLVYKLSTSDYTGGAHGMYGITFLNFDPETGKVLRLKDLFKPGYEEALDSLLLAKLMKDTDSANLEELEDKAYLQDTEIYPSENFFLTDSGITFVYNVYEIAPYSSGITEISLTNEQIEGLLKKRK